MDTAQLQIEGDVSSQQEERESERKIFALRSRRVGLLILAAFSMLLLAAGLLYYLRTERQKPPAVAQPRPENPPALPEPAEVPVKMPVKPPEVDETKPAEKPVKQEEPANTVKIEKTPARVAVNTLSVMGYSAMMTRDLAGAQRDYARLFAQDPQNREALLGLAAIALERKDTALAERYYSKVLEIDPEDPVATAGLVDLRNPEDGESRLKTLLRHSPDSGALNFSLGNRYASRSSWSEAQQAYASAYGSEPGNADFAFNLAVSLDHLGQIGQALKFYRRAIELSERGFTGFDVEAAKNRIGELEVDHAGTQ